MDLLHALLSLVIFTSLALLGAEQHKLSIRLIALQGLILGSLPALAGGKKAMLSRGHVGHFRRHQSHAPAVATQAHGQASAARAAPRPIHGVDYPACVLLGVVGLIVSLWLGGRLKLTANPLFFATVSRGHDHHHRRHSAYRHPARDLGPDIQVSGA